MRTHAVDKLLEQYCYKSAAGLLQLVRFYVTSCVRTACPKMSTSKQQLVTTLIVDIIRLVANLFQQVCYSLDVTILLQPCVVNLVTFLLYHD